MAWQLGIFRLHLRHRTLFVYKINYHYPSNSNKLLHFIYPDTGMLITLISCLASLQVINEWADQVRGRTGKNADILEFTA